MRTTVDIADPLYADLKMQAAEEKTSVKALVHEAARMLLNERRTHRQRTTARKPWPKVGSADSPKIGPFSNDFAFFGDSDGGDQ